MRQLLLQTIVVGELLLIAMTMIDGVAAGKSPGRLLHTRLSKSLHGLAGRY